MATYKSYPSYEEAPFILQGVNEVIIKKVLDRGESISHVTGEVTPATWYKGGGVSLKDAKPYIKMFKEGQMVISELSHPANIILGMILTKLKPHANTVEIAQKEAVNKYKNLLGAGYYKGVCELLDYGVIAKTKRRNLFFINTNMFFNGDRVKWQKIKLQES